MISIIAALDEKRGIGKDNKIPWHIKEDLIRLKSLTKDHVVILGRKTYESMSEYYDRSGREMPGKLYVVVTRDETYKPKRSNAGVAHSLEVAIQIAKEKGANEIFIMGGGQIFQEAMGRGLVDRLYLTLVEGDYGADTFFPDYSKFTKVISEEDRESGEFKYKFIDLAK